MITETKKDSKIKINKNDWENFSLTLDLLSHEKDKINGDYIQSDDINKLINYLDN